MEDEKAHFDEKNDSAVRIYDSQRGFMGPCCTYKITEVQWGVFEKDVLEWQMSGQLDIDEVLIEEQRREKLLIYQWEDYTATEDEPAIKRDTVIIP